MFCCCFRVLNIHVRFDLYERIVKRGMCYGFGLVGVGGVGGHPDFRGRVDFA